MQRTYKKTVGRRVNKVATEFPSNWRIHCATEIHFGYDCLVELGELCKIYGKTVLLVTGKSAVRTGLADRCLQLLNQAGISTGHDDSISHDPTIHQVDNLVAKAKNRSVDAFVAVGGGSVIDAVKAASVIVVQGGLTVDYLSSSNSVGEKSLPVVAVPTTAGTGSELSKGAIITWPEKMLKAGIRGNALFPKAAVVDPVLTMTLPLSQVKITGFDIFTHAVETCISRKANPVTEMISQEAIKAVCHWLPRAIHNPDNKEARYFLSLFSMLVGFNLANSSTCLPHRLQYPLGALTNSAHAVGLAALYPAWIKLTYAASRHRFDMIANWMSEGMDIKPGQSVQTLLHEFMARIDFSPSLTDLEISEEQCSLMAGMVSGSLQNDPWWRSGADLTQLYLRALKHSG